MFRHTVLPSYFEIIINSQEIAKIVERGPVFPLCFTQQLYDILC